MKEPIDLSRLQKGKFHLILAIVSFITIICFAILFPFLISGFIVSYLFQWSILEFRLLLFWWNPVRSANFSILIGLFSLLGNAVLLGIGLQKIGMNFILGFFLAYFSFLTIFVFVALNSRGSKLPK
ncbi:MAG: hypothetical protein GW938_01695 [Leptospira sp.]|nr:hypothetical protein [Leptospira sp.]NCS92482.1 hypothetical protein [Leptospira sp.]